MENDQVSIMEKSECEGRLFRWISGGWNGFKECLGRIDD